MRNNKLVNIILISITIVILFNIKTFAEKIVYPKRPTINGKNLVFSYQGNLWQVDIETKKYYPLTTDGNTNTNPKFSQNGNMIAFNATIEGNRDVYTLDLNTKKIKRLTYNTVADYPCTWTNDDKNILFKSYRESFPGYGMHYLINKDGGEPEAIGGKMLYAASFEPDGNRMAININPTLWPRKGYKGPTNADIWVFDREDIKYTRLTEYEGVDRWPMWAKDGFIYFVSDRDGTFNIWKVNSECGEAIQMTFHKDDDVQFPYLDKEQSQIVYEYEFELWLLDLKTKKTKKINLDFWNTKIEKNDKSKYYFNHVDEFDLYPTGKRIVFSIRGDIFINPIDKGESYQITDNPARDRNPKASPDGKWIAFISDRTGQEQVYIVNIHGKRLQQLTNRHTIKLDIKWSPDSKNILINELDGSLYNYSIETGNEMKIVDVPLWYATDFNWSPDGKWIAYSADEGYNDEIYMISSKGGIPINISNHGANETKPKFSADGKYLGFISDRDNGRQLYVMSLVPEDKDLKDKEGKLREIENKIMKTKSDKKPQPKPQNKPLKYDFKRIKSRTKQITRLKGGVNDFMINPNASTFYFTNTELISGNIIHNIYMIDQEGENYSKINSTVKGISNLTLSKNNMLILYKEGKTAYKQLFRIKSPINTKAKVKIREYEEKLQVFTEAWRIIEQYFYDPNHHGKDWEAIREKYEPLVRYTHDRTELAELIHEMFGELNASHVWAFHPIYAKYRTPALPFIIKKDKEIQRYKIEYIYPESTADKDYVKIDEGNYILEINGLKLTTNDNISKILNTVANQRYITITLSKSDSIDRSWKTRLKVISNSELKQLQYKKWVDDNRKKVDELSNHRIAYCHILGMGYHELHQFYLDMQKYRNKEAIIIDIRYNRGGNIDQQLIDFLERRQYQEIKTRNMDKPRTRPYNGFFGKKLVMINEFCASDAEIFPKGFKDLKLGKIVGMPTMGAVIWMWGHELLDGTSMPIPAGRSQTVKGEILENNPVKPDIQIQNPPEDYFTTKDKQLEKSVEILLQDIEDDK